MKPAQYEEVVKLLEARPGVPTYWAHVFVKTKLSLRAVETYLETCSLDRTSPLRVGTDNMLMRDLEDVANDLDLGDSSDKPSKCDTTIRYVVTAAEREAIVRETSHYAKVHFRTNVSASYTGHVVARSIRQINMMYLMRMVPRTSRVLEVGADLKTLPFRAVSVGSYMATAPFLTVRDVVRGPTRRSLESIVNNTTRRYDADVINRARILLEDPTKLVERSVVQESSFRADCIVSNDANHDVLFDDMPSVMAKRGATTWIGAMIRAKGVSRISRSGVGEVPVLGARYRIDRSRDTIDFHFKCDPSFNYVHKFSEHLKYEERNDYLFRGNGADYVYTKLPATTDSTLFFCVFRVPTIPHVVSEPRYVPTWEGGLVRITSVKAVGDEVSGIPKRFVPCKFSMDREIFEKVMERRRALGVSGNLATTISYLRSVRVKFYVNGVAIGSEGTIDQAMIESAAVAIEVKAADDRLAAEASLSLIDKGYRGRTKGWFETLVAQIVDLRNVSGRIRHVVEDSWAKVRASLASHILEWTKDFEIDIEYPSPYQAIDSDDGRVLDEVVRDATQGCVCSEIAEVRAALAQQGLSRKERVALDGYLTSLLKKGCDVCPDAATVLEQSVPDEVEEVFFDAVDKDVSDSAYESQTVSDDSGSSAVAEEKYVPPVGDQYLQTMEEYAGLQRFHSRALRSEVKRDASLLFRNGFPSELTLSRFATGRTQHYLVYAERGRVVRIRGGPVQSLSRVYDLETGTLVVVQQTSSGMIIPGGNTRVYYASSHLEVFNYDNLASAVESVLSTPGLAFDLESLKFVQGVPGAGKTREIVASMKEKRGFATILYLSATKASADSVRKQVYQSDKDGVRYVRTLDSYLLGDAYQVDHLWIDEAPMAHAGQVFAAILLARPKMVSLWGDFQQIPFCSFTNEFQTPLASLRRSVSLESRSCTHRCRLDVCAMWYDVYEHGLYPCVCCPHMDEEDSVSVVRIAGIADIKYMPNTRYLVFTQKEKQDLHQALGFDASIDVVRTWSHGGLATVHEDQGSTYDSVVLVRGIARYDAKESPLAPSIYNRQEYVLTATTRHKRKFVYYTVSVEDDLVCRRVALSKDSNRRARVREIRRNAKKA